jgi:TRAP-type mannitol/chloroaromatic compound transport system permease large subunit
MFFQANKSQAKRVPATAARPPLSPKFARLVRESIWFVLVAVLAYVALVLASYAPGDPAWSYTGDGAPIRNRGGAVGAAGALIIALARRRLDRAGLWRVLVETGQITVSVLFLIISANLYSRMLTLSGLPQAIVGAMAQAHFGVAGFFVVYIAIVLALGCIIDSGSIMLIVLPLLLPVARSLGLDLVWFGVITVIAVEIGLLTPPFGLSVYVVKSTLNDPRIGLADIFAGTLPFTVMMFAVMLIVIFVPWFARGLL